RKIEKTSDLKFRFTEAPAGANHYLATGKSMPDSTVRLCDEADAILLGACGLPSVRYPDNTEIMPQVELRFHFDLYAGVRPARLIPGVPSPIVGADQRGIDLVLIRESTEGLFASMGKGVVTDSEARETLVITRRTSERLFEFAFRLTERRKARGRAGDTGRAWGMRAGEGGGRGGAAAVGRGVPAGRWGAPAPGAARAVRDRAAGEGVRGGLSCEPGPGFVPCPAGKRPEKPLRRK